MGRKRRFSVLIHRSALSTEPNPALVTRELTGGNQPCARPGTEAASLGTP
jgi:hypothetical protein